MFVFSCRQRPPSRLHSVIKMGGVMRRILLPLLPYLFPSLYCPSYFFFLQPLLRLFPFLLLFSSVF